MLDLSRAVLYLLLMLSVVFSTEYRFLQINGRLYATDGINVWHVNVSNYFKNKLPNASSIKVLLQDPFPIMSPDKNGTSLVAHGSSLKCAFVANLSNECVLLVLVDQQLNYRGWSVRVDPQIFTRGKQKTNATKQGPPPLILEELKENSMCDGSIFKIGNLKNFAPLRDFFMSGQMLTSVFGRHHNTILYFMGMSAYIKLNITKWTRDKRQSFVKLMPIESSVCKQGETIISFRNKYMLLVNHSKMDICLLKSWQPMQIDSKCTGLQMQEVNWKSDIPDSFVNSSNSKIHDGNIAHFNQAPIEYSYLDPTTAAPGMNPILILLLVVVVLAIVLTIAYLLVVKYCCHKMITMPLSGIDSQVLGKMHSTSSIKTINTNEGKNMQGKKAKKSAAKERQY